MRLLVAPLLAGICLGQPSTQRIFKVGRATVRLVEITAGLTEQLLPLVETSERGDEILLTAVYTSTEQLGPFSEPTAIYHAVTVICPVIGKPGAAACDSNIIGVRLDQISSVRVKVMRTVSENESK